MKKSFLFLISSALLSINAIGQHTSSIIGGTAIYLDKPFKYEFQELPENYHETIIEFKRTYGYYLGYSNSYKFKNEISIEVSPQIHYTQDELTLLDSESYMDLTNGHIIFTGKVNERTEKGASIGFMVPVSLKKNLFDSPLSVIAGINFTADRLIVATKYTGITDPAFTTYYNRYISYYDTLSHDDSYGRYKSAPYTSRFGIGAQVGLEYQIAQFGITCNFVSTNLTHKPANSVSIGLKYYLHSKS